MDRSTYTQGAHVNFVMTDLQMNIDPTDEDTWTFSTTPEEGKLYYWMFDESGGKYQGGDVVPINREQLDFDDNGYLEIDTGADGVTVLKFEDNKNQVDRKDHNATKDLATLVTVVETAPNSGIFENFDDDDASNLRVASVDVAKRGTTAVIDYNDACLLYTSPSPRD